MAQTGPARLIEKVERDGRLEDLRLTVGGRSFLLLGESGSRRELAFLPEDGGADLSGVLPVLVGSGMGHALAEIISRSGSAPDFAMAVVDKEDDILKATGLREKFKSVNILWVGAGDAQTALKELGKWQLANGNRAFRVFTNPSYLRLDREFYSGLRQTLEAGSRFNFWERASYPKFKGKTPRPLLITSKYFLTGELTSALERMGVEHRLLQLPDQEVGLGYFMEQLMSAVLEFRPDFAMTINHLGVDREGVLPDILSRIKLPLASWFVDNPHLILYHYRNLINPWTAVFTWDADNIESLRKLGFENVFYLPLGTDCARFSPARDYGALASAHPEWKSRVSFVGNSMLNKVKGRLKHSDPPGALRDFKKVAAAFGDSDEHSVSEFLARAYPERYNLFTAMEPVERRLSYEALITWEATLQYRLSCLKATLPHDPLIAGDNGWFTLLEDWRGKWRYLPELNYYDDLPRFYPLSEVNFNCTSKQMKGAVNQRVFDVPATGSFLLTDWREQLAGLFEPGKEVICYHDPDEAADLLDYYLRKPEERNKIARAAHKRAVAEHDYEKRLETVFECMRKAYA